MRHFPISIPFNKHLLCGTNSQGEMEHRKASTRPPEAHSFVRDSPISSTNQANWPPQNRAVSTRGTNRVGPRAGLKASQRGSVLCGCVFCNCCVLVFCSVFTFSSFLSRHSLITKFILQAAGMAKLDFHDPNPQHFLPPLTLESRWFCLFSS